MPKKGKRPARNAGYTRGEVAQLLRRALDDQLREHQRQVAGFEVRLQMQEREIQRLAGIARAILNARDQLVMVCARFGELGAEISRLARET